MYRQSCFNELIEHNRIYQYFTDKMDVPSHLYKERIPKVCEAMDLNYELMQAILKTYDDSSEFPYREMEKFSIAEVLNYLKLTHKFYLNKKLPEMEQTAIQVFRKYNDTHTLLSLLCMFFTDYKKKLEEHIRYEERRLFPYIEKLIEIDSNGVGQQEILMVLNAFSAKSFIENHTNIEDELQEVRKTILKYTEHEKTPLPYRVFLSQLQYFEIELCKHALMEDNILIPRVIELEAHLLKKAASATLTKHNFS